MYSTRNALLELAGMVDSFDGSLSDEGLVIVDTVGEALHAAGPNCACDPTLVEGLFMFLLGDSLGLQPFDRWH